MVSFNAINLLSLILTSLQRFVCNNRHILYIYLLWYKLKMTYPGCWTSMRCIRTPSKCISHLDDSCFRIGNIAALVPSTQVFMHLVRIHFLLKFGTQHLPRRFSTFTTPFVVEKQFSRVRLVGSSFDLATFIVSNRVSLSLALHLFYRSLVVDNASTWFQLAIATRIILPNVLFPVLFNIDEYRKFVETF